LILLGSLLPHFTPENLYPSFFDCVSEDLFQFSSSVEHGGLLSTLKLLRLGYSLNICRQLPNLIRVEGLNNLNVVADILLSLLWRQLQVQHITHKLAKLRVLCIWTDITVGLRAVVGHDYVRSVLSLRLLPIYTSQSI